MSKAIILYNYNQYYNRTIFRKDTFAEYQALITPVSENTPAQYRGLLREDFNFDYNDGVHASKVLNIAKNEEAFYKVNHPNYIVIEESWNEGTLEESVIIKNLTRWFILDCKKVRGCQFELSLRRDLIADFYPDLLTAPCFIERGNPQINDPAIFNREGFTFNQIKRKELLLTNTKLSGKGGGWVVGYLARNDKDNGNAVSEILNAEGHQELPPAALIPQFSSLPVELQSLLTATRAYKTLNRCWVNFVGKVKGIFTNVYTKPYLALIETTNEVMAEITGTYVGSAEKAPLTFNTRRPSTSLLFSDADLLEYVKNHYNTSVGFLAKVRDVYDSLSLQNRFTTDYSSYNGTYVIKDGKYYKMYIRKLDYVGNVGTQVASITKSQITSGSSALAIAFNSYLNDCIDDPYVVSNLTNVSGTQEVATFYQGEELWGFDLQLVDFETIKTSIKNTRNENLEAPYDLFCIPMGEVGVKNNGVLQFTTQLNTALAMARGIAVKGTTALVYDIQVLPYCPYPEMINSDGDIEINNYVEHKDYEYITQTIGGTTSNMGILLFPRSCRGTFDLSIPSSFDGYEEYCVEEIEDAVVKKVKSETQLIRFVSPNFSAVFEINAQKNAGISELNVDYFYKPYSPYIHVAPYFKGLYGGEFNDPKGLVCSGDFSISTAQSQWELYQIQNKNYELIFNRQIENLDINNQITYEQQRISSGINAFTAGVSGAVSGAVAGFLVGGPVGAAIGGVGAAALSGGASAIGRSYDLEFLTQKQQEARSYAVDMYTYNLGNIKALPNTLTKVSSLTENNKIFPFIEFYDCTDEEKEALRNKIQYNGMTVMRIGTINNFIDGDRNYVQAQLIRMLNLTEDSHVVSELANELKQGAYYYGDDSI